MNPMKRRKSPPFEHITYFIDIHKGKELSFKESLERDVAFFFVKIKCSFCVNVNVYLNKKDEKKH